MVRNSQSIRVLQGSPRRSITPRQCSSVSSSQGGKGCPQPLASASLKPHSGHPHVRFLPKARLFQCWKRTTLGGVPSLPCGSGPTGGGNSEGPALGGNSKAGLGDRSAGTGHDGIGSPPPRAKVLSISVFATRPGGTRGTGKSSAEGPPQEPCDHRFFGPVRGKSFITSSRRSTNTSPPTAACG